MVEVRVTKYYTDDDPQTWCRYDFECQVKGQGRTGLAWHLRVAVPLSCTR